MCQSCDMAEHQTVEIRPVQPGDHTQVLALAPRPAHRDRSPPAPASPGPGRCRSPRHHAAAACAAAPAARSAAGHPASSRCRRYPYPQNVLLAAFGTPSPYYRTRRTFLYQPHLRRTTAPARCPITTEEASRPWPTTRTTCRAAAGSRSGSACHRITRTLAVCRRTACPLRARSDGEPEVTLGHSRTHGHTT